VVTGSRIVDVLFGRKTELARIPNMVIALEGRRRWLFLLAFTVLSSFYVLIAGKEFAASLFGTRPTLSSLRRAVLLSPGNAEYRNRLGRFFAFVTSDSQAAITNFQSAVQLNPHQARYWFDLANIRQLVGDSDGQRAALERALIAEPTAPQVAWEAANFFLVSGDTDRALREFHVVIENDPSLAGPALQACWRVLPDTDALLRDVVPARVDTLISFHSMLVAKQETDGSIKVWDRLTQLNQKFEPRFLFDYVRYLLLMRRPDAAVNVWRQTVNILGLSAYLPTPDNLVVNAEFNLDVLNGGFDWIYQTQPGVRLLLDPSNYREGHRSLSITFEGPGISDAGIRQLIPVRGGTAYDFTAYYKSADFEGAGGPQLSLRDGYTGQVLASTDPLKDADFWKPVHASFTTPPSTTLLILNVDRVPSGAAIRGKLWLDDFELSPSEDRDHP
jgi:tetratricopeptide (TPR) repeat protein